MNRNFSINEILESIDEIVTNNKNKKFSNKNINITDNPETEKIISDAEKTLKSKLKETPLILEKEFVENEDHQNRDFTKNIIEVEKNFNDLREDVTSKGGTTEAVITCLKKNNFEKLIHNSITDSIKKAKTLSSKKVR